MIIHYHMVYILILGVLINDNIHHVFLLVFINHKLNILVF